MKFVPEVNGMRALAVVAVVLYHLELHWIPGGFVGVDVFFVISGYLITSIIGAELAHGHFSFRVFYGRRMMRILPALYVVSIATALLFSALFPPQLSGELLKSMVAGLLSYSNLWFYFTVDYFADNVTQPTLHYWSLAVEEQFYLVLPLLYWALWRAGGARLALRVFALLFVVSLGWACWVVGTERSAAFFLPWLRAWELLAGSLLSLAPLHRWSPRVKRWLAEAGLAMVLLAIFLYDSKMVFPGYNAILPVLGTVLMIAGAGAGGVANRLLSSPPAQWLGKVSYSLYLVHWPLICLVSLVFALTFKFKLLVIAASLLTAWLSWKFIEAPFRRPVTEANSGQVTRVTLAATAACAALFVVFNLGGTRLWQQYPDAIAYTQPSHADTTFFNRDTCFLTSQSNALSFYRKDLCLTPAAGRPNVLVIGDSHAANIVEALKLESPGAHVMQATAVGCKPTLEPVGEKRCTDLVRYIYNDWLPRHKGVAARIIIAGRWDGADGAALADTLAYLRGLDQKATVYGPVPEYLVPAPLILAYEQFSKMPLRAWLVKADRRAVDAAFAERFGPAAYFSPYRNLCPASGCLMERDGVPLFFDRDHLTPRGARLAVKGLDADLNGAAATRSPASTAAAAAKVVQH